MRRYLLIALIIGAVSVLLTVMLYEIGLLSGAADKLATYYANANFLDHGARPGRLLHYLVFTVFGFGVAWAMIDVPKISHKSIIAVGSLILVTLFSVLLATFGVLFEPFSTTLTLFFATVLGLIYTHTEHGGRKLNLQTVLGGRVSESAFGELLEGPRPEFLDGQNRDVTVLTVRVFNHAILRKSVDPDDLIAMTNLFLQNSGEFLTSRGGYLDESSPDCVRVYFGILHQEGNHSYEACDAALELRQRLDNLNQELEKQFFQELEYGIAISTDEMTLGIYESDNDVRLSAVGEVIEFVRKLSAANHRYGSRILVSARTYSIIREKYALRPMEMIFDASAELMSEVYELVNLKEALPEDAEDARQRFWQAVIYYREGEGEKALELFSELKAEFPDDRSIQYFIDRSQSNMVDDSKTARRDLDLHLMHGHARVLHSL